MKMAPAAIAWAELAEEFTNVPMNDVNNEMLTARKVSIYNEGNQMLAQVHGICRKPRDSRIKIPPYGSRQRGIVELDPGKSKETYN